MSKFEEAYAQLNAAQKRAVDQLDGPVLVIAGPGTGKTQLLAVRIANILATTDTNPANILCLTFTDSAAHAMRERLVGFIGQAAWEVTISTYHAFGSELIRRYPDYFLNYSDQQPADDLRQDTILRTIIAELPYSNPLKHADLYLRDIKTLISDAKRALLTPTDLQKIATANQKYIQKASQVVSECLEGIARIDKKSIPKFAKLLDELTNLPPAGQRGAASFEVVTVPEVEPESQPFETLGSKVGSPRVNATEEDAAPLWPNDKEEKINGKGLPKNIQPLANLLVPDLAKALEEAENTGKTTPLTTWKNTYLAKNDQNQFILDGKKTNQKLAAAAHIYQTYLDALAAANLFDYDDMILRAVHALQTHADLRYSLQEQYLYLLLDEFQDTNGAQLRLVELLTDNPVNESRPNVLAVGDDDQAIYAFQGANYSHMLRFQQLYRDVLLVPLTENYRSHQDILDLSHGLAEQIDERLHHRFPGIDKTIVSANRDLPKRAVLERREAKSDVAQFAWVTQRIQQLIKNGTPASEIAVLAPKHKYLEPLVPFLQAAGVPVRYEKRENVLDDPAVNQLLRMSELCVALGEGDTVRAGSLWPEVLSFAFWGIPTSVIWRLSWAARDNDRPWTVEVLEDETLKPVGLFFVRLGQVSSSETLETMVDFLIGTQAVDLQEPGFDAFQSPFFGFYFQGASEGKVGSTLVSTPPTPSKAFSLGNAVDTKSTAAFSQRAQLSSEVAFTRGEVTFEPRVSKDQISGSTLGGVTTSEETAPAGSSVVSTSVSAGFWDLLNNLIVLRARLREYQASNVGLLNLKDLLEFVRAHREAGIKVVNSSPYQEAAEAVQLLTAFKAKGQEWGTVFLVAVGDEAWGSRARGAGSRLSLPPNVRFIRYGGATDDERLRLLYVAATRAKAALFLVNYTSTYTGKAVPRLKFLDESVDEDGTVQSPLLPAGHERVLPAEADKAAPKTELMAYWQQRHTAALSRADIGQLLRERLQQFQLSPTHLGDFTDVVNCGPEAFFLKTILRFPEAMPPQVRFGEAMHETLEWLHRYFKQEGQAPAEALVLKTFEKRLRRKRLNEQTTTQLLARGQASLRAWLQQRLHTVSAANEAEYNFRGAGVFVGKVHVGGKIDKLIIDPAAKTIQIVDYKTGRAYNHWERVVKLHKYQQQLYFYKILVEGAARFAGYKVTAGALEFVEPDDDGRIVTLPLTFDDAVMKHTKQLIQAVGERIATLKLPDVSQYSTDLAGIEAFEQDLLA